MKNVWLTYAWADNEDEDIDFIIQELDKTNLHIKFDRRNLIPGQRLWTQIGGAITDPEQCDAWGVVLTANSLKSERCIEELSYALDRALTSNGEQFPMFALIHKISASEMPPALKIRLSIPLESNNWADQVVAAANKEAVGFTPENVSDFVLREHVGGDLIYLEIRPRFDRISPFQIAVEYSEKESGNVRGRGFGPSGQIPQSSVLYVTTEGEGNLPDGTRVWVWGANNEATSTSSYFLSYEIRPKRIWFGHPNNLKFVNLSSV